jgi:hypothetical protein
MPSIAPANGRQPAAASALHVEHRLALGRTRRDWAFRWQNLNAHWIRPVLVMALTHLPHWTPTLDTQLVVDYRLNCMKKLDVPQSGSQADTTASRNRFGQYNRTRAMPTQPRTDAQLAVRSYLTNVSQAWRELTDAQRTAWSEYAAAHPRVDSLGSTIVLTGHQMFNGVNVLNMQAGIAIQNAVPDGTVLTALNPTVDDGTAAGLSVTVSDSVPVTDTIIVFASPPQSAGRSFIGDLRVVASLVGTATADQEVLTAADLTTKYGTLAAGQKFAVSIKRIRDGNVSPSAALAFVLT